MYFTSNERDYSSLSTGIFISENESKKKYREFFNRPYLNKYFHWKSDILHTCR